MLSILIDFQQLIDEKIKLERLDYTTIRSYLINYEKKLEPIVRDLTQSQQHDKLGIDFADELYAVYFSSLLKKSSDSILSVTEKQALLKIAQSMDEYARLKIRALWIEADLASAQQQLLNKSQQLKNALEEVGQNKSKAADCLLRSKALIEENRLSLDYMNQIDRSLYFSLAVGFSGLIVSASLSAVLIYGMGIALMPITNPLFMVPASAALIAVVGFIFAAIYALDALMTHAYYEERLVQIRHLEFEKSGYEATNHVKEHSKNLSDLTRLAEAYRGEVIQLEEDLKQTRFNMQLFWKTAHQVSHISASRFGLFAKSANKTAADGGLGDDELAILNQAALV